MSYVQVAGKQIVVQFGIKKLYDVIKDVDYGTKYTWEELEEMSDIPHAEKREQIYYAAKRVCELLMKFNHKYLLTVPKYGKRVIQPNEHCIVAKHKVEHSVKIYRHAGAIIASTNTKMLTETERTQVILDSNRYNTLELFVSEALKNRRAGQLEDTTYKSPLKDSLDIFKDKKSK